MSFDRKNIRKLILLEIIKKIDSRHSIDEGPYSDIVKGVKDAGDGALIMQTMGVGSIVKGAAMTAVQNSAPDSSQEFHKQLLSGEVYKTQKEFFDNLENPEVLHVNQISMGEATQIAKKFLVALEGIGTAEEDVRAAIGECKSQLGISKVSYFYSDVLKYSSSLYEDINEDMADMGIVGQELRDYVTRPINELPFAIVNGSGVTKDEYEKLVGQAGGKDGGTGDELLWGLEAPYVRNIILTMNEYAKVKSLQGYNPASGSDWTSAVQACWVLFSTHALTNCALYSSFKPSGAGDVASWVSMSGNMRSTFPGYTANPRGCLAFCLDAYYCELRYGNKSGGSSGGGVGVVPPPKVTKDKAQAAARTYKDIIVKVTSGGETVPLSTVFDATVQKDFIYELEQNFKDSVQKSAVQKSTMQIDLIFGVGFKKVKDVKRRRPVGGSSRINFKGNIQRTFEEFFNSARLARAPEGNLKSYSDKRRMRIEIDIPANYTPTGNRRE